MNRVFVGSAFFSLVQDELETGCRSPILSISERNLALMWVGGIYWRLYRRKSSENEKIDLEPIYNKKRVRVTS